MDNKIGWLKYAIRKNFLRVDVHVSFPPQYEVSDPAYAKSMCQDYLEAATLRGLDLVCIISDWLYPGRVAQEIIQQKGIDLIALPGIEMVTSDNLTLLAININKEIEQRLDFEHVCKRIYNEGGFTVVVAPPKRWAHKLNNYINEPWAPVGVEVYNAHFMEFTNYNLDAAYEPFIASGAMSAEELLNTTLHTKIDRKWWKDLLSRKSS